MLKVVLTSFFFIILAELALRTVLLLGQLVFYTYASFETLKLHYEYGLVVMVLHSGSRVRGFDPPMIFVFLCQIFFLITVVMIFSPSIYFIRVIDFIYIFYNRKSCTNLHWSSVLK